MNLVAHVFDLSPAGANVLIYVKIVLNDGNQTSGAVEVSPTVSAAQQNTQLANGIRQIVRDTLGLVVAANTPVTIWNAAVKV